MNVNRIFCIGKNYADHVAELAHLAPAGAAPASKPTVSHSAKTSPPAKLQAPADEDCTVFLKPTSCIVPEGRPIRLPKGRGSVHHEAELVVMLTGGDRDIPMKHALSTIAGLTLGLDLTLRELQTALKQAGKPWELAKAFDDAAPLGDFKPYLEQKLQKLEFRCLVNGEQRQHGRTKEMLYTVARQIHILSRTWSLAPGDVIYTGTPAGVGPLRTGDEVVLESPSIGRFRWLCE